MHSLSTVVAILFGFGLVLLYSLFVMWLGARKVNAESTMAVEALSMRKAHYWTLGAALWATNFKLMLGHYRVPPAMARTVWTVRVLWPAMFVCAFIPNRVIGVITSIVMMAIPVVTAFKLARHAPLQAPFLKAAAKGWVLYFAGGFAALVVAGITASLFLLGKAPALAGAATFVFVVLGLFLMTRGMRDGMCMMWRTWLALGEIHEDNLDVKSHVRWGAGLLAAYCVMLAAPFVLMMLAGVNG